MDCRCISNLLRTPSLHEIVKLHISIRYCRKKKTDIRTAAPENQQIAYAKTKAQINCEVTAQLFSAFVCATRIVPFLWYLYPTFQTSSVLLCRTWSKIQIVSILMQRLILLPFISFVIQNTFWQYKLYQQIMTKVIRMHFPKI